jgi:predicted extracellular nuclease
MKYALLTVVSMFAMAVPAQAAIVITEVYAAGSGNTSYKADWFELTNTGSSAIDITGWKFDDSSASFASAAAFSGTVTTIAAGQSVIFAEASASNPESTIIPAFTTAWFGSNVPAGFAMSSYTGTGVGLSTAGDAVNIFDSTGTLVASVSFDASTTGFTFDNAAGITGKISQLSAVGVNGAFTSFNGVEVGSPGTIGTTAVPEPSSFALIGLAASGFVARRIRRRQDTQA